MRSINLEIDKIGLQILVKGGEVVFDPADGISKAELSRHGQQIKDLINGKLPLEAMTLKDVAAESLIDNAFPLTDIQYAYLIGRNSGLELGGLASGLYLEFDIANPDLPALNRALNQTVNRHSMLRAITVAGGQQRILDQVSAYEIIVYSDRGWSDSEQSEHLLKIRQEMEKVMLPLDQTPSFDIRATVLNDENVRLHLYFDLMFIDINSVNIVLRDWWLNYENKELVTLSSAAIFPAYIEAERILQGKFQGVKDKQYWQGLLEKLPLSPELPTKCAPELISVPIIKRSSKMISAETISMLKSNAEIHGITLEVMFLGIYVETLRQWSKRQNFTLTLTQLDRRPHFSDVANVVGNFLQPTLLPVWSPENISLAKRLVQLQTDLLSNRLHSSYNGIQVLRELTSRRHENRAASAPIVFSNTLNTDLQDLNPVKFDGVTQVYSSNQTPQVWLENQITTSNGDVWVNWNYVDELFPDGMVETMLDTYINLLNDCAQDASILEQQGSVIKLPIVDTTERQLANSTEIDLAPRLLQEMFLESAEKFPDATAISQGNIEVSYRILREKSNQVANRIREEIGVNPGEIIAVSLPPGPELIIGILGILISGAAYVAIDPTLPEQRRKSLLERCGAKGVISDRKTYDTREYCNDLLCIDVDDRKTLAYSASPVATIQTIDDLAYVIFTSGSTGEPKGVMISHNNASNTVLDINRKFNVTAKDAVFSVAPAGFDLSVYDYFGLLAVGGRIVFQAIESANDPRVWCETLIEHKVTIWNSVPAPVKALVDRCSLDLAKTPLRLILMSGDWIPVDLPNSIRETLPEIEIISLGGATEGSIWSIFYPIKEVNNKWSSIPYGKPLANQKFHVLNDWFAPCPKWVTGELYIAGQGVAQGYLGDNKKTLERFIIHPHTGERLYKTGDLGKYISDGNIEILGREDNQVKINGYRVELGEVEACILTHKLASHVVIDAPEHPKTGQRHLVAYVVPEGDFSEIAQDVLQEQLKVVVQKTLPSYMIPTYYLLLSHMPLTSNGKINRNALPTPWAESEGESEQSVEPKNDVEKKLLKLWRSQVQHDDFGVTNGFFDIGGDSLHAVALLSALREEFNIGPVQEQDLIEGLFMNANIQSFAQIIMAMTETAKKVNA